MRTSEHSQAVTVSRPAGDSIPLIISSPHSGRQYTPEFMAQVRLPLDVLRSGEDFHVDTLMASAPRYGVTVLSATFPRVMCDANRASLDLDPAMIMDAEQQTLRPTVKGLAGLGSIPGVVSGGRQLYASKLSMAETTSRLRRYWHPYHATLQALIDEKKAEHGFCVLLDMHSMPPGVDGSKADCVIGDRFGASSELEYVQALARSLLAEKLSVARNHPFAGGFITSFYGRPDESVSAIQLELNRALYVSRRAGGCNGINPRFGEKMEKVIATFAAFVRDRMQARASESMNHDPEGRGEVNVSGI
ncbi:N-formylglutamate amidohydrolase [Acetobacter sp.]|uniref:N-formylglutamate amidohydrolase n=1 Tax=Acetobacter sp. TaxID=440 RepID=UPI0039EC461F